MENKETYDKLKDETLSIPIGRSVTGYFRDAYKLSVPNNHLVINTWYVPCFEADMKPDLTIRELGMIGKKVIINKTYCGDYFLISEYQFSDDHKLFIKKYERDLKLNKLLNE